MTQLTGFRSRLPDKNDKKKGPSRTPEVCSKLLAHVPRPWRRSGAQVPPRARLRGRVAGAGAICASAPGFSLLSLHFPGHMFNVAIVMKTRARCLIFLGRARRRRRGVVLFLSDSHQPRQLQHVYRGRVRREGSARPSRPQEGCTLGPVVCAGYQRSCRAAALPAAAPLRMCAAATWAAPSAAAAANCHQCLRVCDWLTASVRDWRSVARTAGSAGRRCGNGQGPEHLHGHVLPQDSHHSADARLGNLPRSLARAGQEGDPRCQI
jgi:hypothetical protein